MRRALLTTFVLLLLQISLYPQNIGNLSKIQLIDDGLLLTADTNVIVFKACTENILMINFRHGGHEDPDTLVIGNTLWSTFGASIDTSGDPLRITTRRFKLEINRNPIRYHLYKNTAELLCEELSTGGIMPNDISITTTGGTFYGIHNKNSGTLATQGFNSVYAGNQGQAGGPFVWNTKGWGFLADANGNSISIDPTLLTFSRIPSAQKRDIEFYLFVGNPKEIINGMHHVTGFPPLFPKYTLGFLNTEWGIDQNELYNNIRTYREKSIPIDAYILDFDWMDWGADNYGEFRWGTKFPEGQSGIIADTLKKYNMHLMGIRKPRVHTNTIQGTYCDNHNFFVDYVTDYFSGKQVGRMNFNLPDARKWYWESFALQGNSYEKGITGYWNDEADEYGGNLMFMQMQRSMYEGQRLYNSNRVWSINRNFYTGAQRYAYSLWSGDISSDFTSLANQRLFMISSIVLGVSWWGMDIGGFQSTPTSENYFRWIQFGAFVPVFRVHGTYNQEREPWNYGAEAESIATKYIRLRYQLMPYIYSAARENNLTGISIVRPLVMEYPDDPAVVNLSSEWLFGNDLLVSPVVQQNASAQTVYFPEGDWYDFHTGAHFSGNAQENVNVTRNDIPLYVKAGSLIPMSPPVHYVDAPEAQQTVILSSYAGGTGRCIVYDDDGITYNYEQGEFRCDSILHDRNEKRAIITFAGTYGIYKTPHRDWLAEFNWIRTYPESVVLNDQRLAMISLDSIQKISAIGWSIDSISQKCLVKFPDSSTNKSLIVYFGSTASVQSHEHVSIKKFKLYQNYPNPFNPTTQITYQIPTSGFVSLKVYDMLGKEVATLVNDVQEAGEQQVTFAASNYPSGLYFYTLKSGSCVETKKMLLIK